MASGRTAAGHLIGFSSSKTSLAGSSNGRLDLTDDGWVIFGATASQNMVSSTTGCNDGAWHHVVTTRWAMRVTVPTSRPPRPGFGPNRLNIQLPSPNSTGAGCVGARRCRVASRAPADGGEGAHALFVDLPLDRMQSLATRLLTGTFDVFG